MSGLKEERFKTLTNAFGKIAPILVVGDVGIDKYTFGKVERISPEAPVPVLEVQKEWFKLGLAANVSDNLKGLGVNSTLCGVTGLDRHGDLFDTLLEEEGLKTWGIVRSEGRPTTFKERVTTPIQQVCRIDYETNKDLDDVSKQKFLDRVVDFARSHEAIIIEDYGKGLFSQELLQEMIKILKSQNRLICTDPSRHSNPIFYKGASLIKPNNTESRILVEKLGHRDTSVSERAKILLNELELDMVIITLGAEGMCLLEKGQEGPTIIPTLANEVFDVSGAGDTAISAITCSLLAGATLEEAAWIGNCASGVVVGKKGTAKVSLEELSEYFQKIKHLH